MNSPLRFTLGGEVRKAAYTIQNLTDRDNVNYWDRDTEYTTEMLEAVEGLLFMTVGKLAFIGGIRIATGCVVAKLPDHTWSAPCAVGSFGVTFGACLGAEVTDMVTGVDRETLDKFCTDSVSNVMLGGEAQCPRNPGVFRFFLTLEARISVNLGPIRLLFGPLIISARVLEI